MRVWIYIGCLLIRTLYCLFVKILLIDAFVDIYRLFAYQNFVLFVCEDFCLSISGFYIDFFVLFCENLED